MRWAQRPAGSAFRSHRRFQYRAAAAVGFAVREMPVTKEPEQALVFGGEHRLCVSKAASDAALGCGGNGTWPVALPRLAAAILKVTSIEAQ